MNLMEHEVMGAPIGAEAAGEQKQTIEKARTKIIDAAPLMERLKAAIAFGNEKGLPTDELEQVLADIEGMEEYKGDAIECAIKALSEPLQPWEVLAAQAVLPQPEQDWIPVSEGMPEEREWIGTKKFGTTISDEVYVTFEATNGERFVKHLSFQNGKVPSFKKREIDVWFGGATPVAWKPLPEPWKGDAE